MVNTIVGGQFCEKCERFTCLCNDTLEGTAPVDTREHDAFCECEGCDAKRDAAPCAHYHVLSGMAGGYMPSSNYYAADMDTARALLADIANDFLDDEADDYSTRTVGGSSADGYVTYVNDNDPHDLGEYAEIFPCTDNCDPDADC